jgi:hypothetical protein
MKRRKCKMPFSQLSIKDKFDRLFSRGFSREEAEKKLHYPYKALILPGIIKKYWERAKSSREELTKVWEELGGFTLECSVLDWPLGTGSGTVLDEESILRGISDHILGDEFDYEIVRNCFSCLPIGIVITEYNGVFV